MVYIRHYEGRARIVGRRLAGSRRERQPRRRAKSAALVVFVGTSFSVGVTEYILETALERHAVVYSIDPAGIEPDDRVRVIAAASEHALPAVADALAGRSE